MIGMWQGDAAREGPAGPLKACRQSGCRDALFQGPARCAARALSTTPFKVLPAQP